jgi:hypothetical protein
VSQFFSPKTDELFLDAQRSNFLKRFPAVRDRPNSSRHSGMIAHALELKPVKSSFMSFLESNAILQNGGCSNCFKFNHRRSSCRSNIMCAACFELGHVFKFFLTKSKPKIFRRPKASPHSVQRAKEVDLSRDATKTGVEYEESSPPGTQGAVEHNILSPNRSLATENPIPPSEPVLVGASHIDTAGVQAEESMANFTADLMLFDPEGMNVEEWARPARGRFIITANPSRHHEEYTIISVNPPPPTNHVYEAIDEFMEYFEEVRRIRFRSLLSFAIGAMFGSVSVGHCSADND